MVEFAETLVYVFLDLYLNALGNHKQQKVKEILFEVKRDDAMQTLLIAQDFLVCLSNLDGTSYKEIKVLQRPVSKLVSYCGAFLTKQNEVEEEVAKGVKLIH